MFSPRYRCSRGHVLRDWQVPDDQLDTQRLPPWMVGRQLDPLGEQRHQVRVLVAAPPPNLTALGLPPRTHGIQHLVH
jgi:hypothetical protein